MALGLDCTVLRDLFGTEETRAAVTSEALVQGWLDAERRASPRRRRRSA